MSFIQALKRNIGHEVKTRIVEDTSKSFSRGIAIPELYQFEEITRFGVSDSISAVAYHPVQRLLAAGTAKGQVAIFGKPGIKCYFDQLSTKSIQVLAFHPLSNFLLLAVDARGELFTLDLQRRQMVFSYFLRYKVCDLEFIPNSPWCVVAFPDGAVDFIDPIHNLHATYRLDNLITLSQVQEVRQQWGASRRNPRELVGACVDPANHDQLLIGFSGGHLVLWSLSQQAATFQTFFAPPDPTATQDDHQQGSGSRTPEPIYLTSLCWRPDGAYWVTTYSSGALAFWDPTKLKDGPCMVKQLAWMDFSTEQGFYPTIEYVGKAHWFTLAPESSNSLDPKACSVDASQTVLLVAAGPSSWCAHSLVTFNLCDPLEAWSDSNLPLFKVFEFHDPIIAICLMPLESPWLKYSLAPLAVTILTSEGYLKCLEVLNITANLAIRHYNIPNVTSPIDMLKSDSSTLPAPLELDVPIDVSWLAPSVMSAKYWMVELASKTDKRRPWGNPHFSSLISGGIVRSSSAQSLQDLLSIRASGVVSTHYNNSVYLWYDSLITINEMVGAKIVFVPSTTNSGPFNITASHFDAHDRRLFVAYDQGLVLAIDLILPDARQIEKSVFPALECTEAEVPSGALIFTFNGQKYAVDLQKSVLAQRVHRVTSATSCHTVPGVAAHDPYLQPSYCITHRALFGEPVLIQTRLPAIRHIYYHRPNFVATADTLGGVIVLDIDKLQTVYSTIFTTPTKGVPETDLSQYALTGDGAPGNNQLAAKRNSVASQHSGLSMSSESPLAANYVSTILIKYCDYSPVSDPDSATHCWRLLLGTTHGHLTNALLMWKNEAYHLHHLSLDQRPPDQATTGVVYTEAVDIYDQLFSRLMEHHPTEDSTDNGPAQRHSLALHRMSINQENLGELLTRTDTRASIASEPGPAAFLQAAYARRSTGLLSRLSLKRSSGKRSIFSRAGSRLTMRSDTTHNSPRATENDNYPVNGDKAATGGASGGPADYVRVMRDCIQSGFDIVVFQSSIHVWMGGTKTSVATFDIKSLRHPLQLDPGREHDRQWAHAEFLHAKVVSPPQAWFEQYQQTILEPSLCDETRSDGAPGGHSSASDGGGTQAPAWNTSPVVLIAVTNCREILVFTLPGLTLIHSVHVPEMTGSRSELKAVVQDVILIDPQKTIPSPPVNSRAGLSKWNLWSSNRPVGVNVIDNMLKTDAKTIPLNTDYHQAIRQNTSAKGISDYTCNTVGTVKPTNPKEGSGHAETMDMLDERRRKLSDMSNQTDRMQRASHGFLKSVQDFNQRQQNDTKKKWYRR
ncbi:Lethal(2) giant larvae sro7 [Dimargaris verticillata]|uniref:Lethal(2) giant larvae sro7 n=1 Tax=Dimargaris verticillata TaxID=2761393 RepID=A0A9W8E984_9FUNG|nr:Lethal(2) giant larvae sro7 [Dimargaris verticillata]